MVRNKRLKRFELHILLQFRDLSTAVKLAQSIAHSLKNFIVYRQFVLEFRDHVVDSYRNSIIHHQLSFKFSDSSSIRNFKSGIKPCQNFAIYS